MPKGFFFKCALKWFNVFEEMWSVAQKSQMEWQVNLCPAAERRGYNQVVSFYLSPGSHKVREQNMTGNDEMT